MKNNIPTSDPIVNGVVAIVTVVALAAVAIVRSNNATKSR